MTSGGADRRQFPRSRTSVNLHPAAATGILNHVDNISANGVLCHTEKPLPLMTRMRIGLELPKPHSRAIDAEGVVVRCDPPDSEDEHYRVAILFTRLSDEEHEAIRKFVEHDLADAPKGGAASR